MGDDTYRWCEKIKLEKQWPQVFVSVLDFVSRGWSSNSAWGIVFLGKTLGPFTPKGD